MRESMIMTAKNRLTGKPVHIEDANRGKLSGTACFDCGEILIARKGRIRAPHFSHLSKTNCSGESNLHKYAKYILAEQRRICLRHYPKHIKPTRHQFDYAEVEYSIEEFRVDCFLYDEEIPSLAVEIKVTHSASEEKREMFRRKQLAAVEIDLSRLPRFPSREDIRREVCNHHCNVTWLYNAKHDEHNKQMVENLNREYGVKLKLPY
ncbi:hypothetical protein M1N56_06365 [Dehalococcoidia bacterium]|nr:hypothetical protein [Dehalococcoidia bacterium]